MINDKRFSDIVILVGPEEVAFHCHKIILAKSSDVFAAMFSHEDTVEMEKGEIRIPDIDPKDFGDFLTFLYGGFVENGCNYEVLLALAEKYNVENLKVHNTLG